MPNALLPTISESFTRAIEQAWDRTLAVAQNHVQAFDDQGRHPPSSQSSRNPPPQDTQSNRVSSEFYDRERHMMQALDILFGYAHEGPGYLAFIRTMTMILDPDSPVAMAFLSHIIERSALPSKQTMEAISPVILSTMERGRNFYRPSTLHSATNFFHKWMVMFGLKSKQVQPIASTRLKLNATVIWSLLAEKYAGDMCMHMWNSQVGRLLIDMLVDPHEDLMVRLFSLLALEKFSLTGTIKSIILETSDIQHVLQTVIEECEKANNDFFAMTHYLTETDAEDELNLPPRRQRLDSYSSQESKSFIRQGQQQGAPQQQELRRTTVKSCFKQVLHMTTDHVTQLWKRDTADDNIAASPPSFSTNTATYSAVTPMTTIEVTDLTSGGDAEHGDDFQSQTKQTELQPQPHSQSWRSRQAEAALNMKQKEPPSTPHSDTHKESTFMNSFDTGFIPPHGPIRDTWAKYLQLSFCARWALENVFNEGKQHIKSTPWDLSHIRTIMNPFDATPHWKFGNNGLEVRNDRPHFESIRATASVKTGKWYYETLLLSSGIMQLGWATSRCRFTPEEGYGVGDDCNGFAFDTYRTAVWADGTAVYPQIKLKVRCQSGDVLGSFLDLDNGLCSYFINGKDLGLTIEFENPTKQAAKANAKTNTEPSSSVQLSSKEVSSSIAASTGETVTVTSSPITESLPPTFGSIQNDQAEQTRLSMQSPKPVSMSSSSSFSPSLSPATSSSSSPSQKNPSRSSTVHQERKKSRNSHRHHYHHYRQIPSQDPSSSTSTESLGLSRFPPFSADQHYSLPLTSSDSFSSDSSPKSFSPRIAPHHLAATTLSSTSTLSSSSSSPTPSSSAAGATGATATRSASEPGLTSETVMPPTETRSAKGLGLYPAVSLTTHQHILINLGDRPWIYPPPITCRYRGVSEAGRLDREYRRRVLRWVNQRGYRIRKLHLAENHSPIRPHSNSSRDGTGVGNTSSNGSTRIGGCCYAGDSGAEDYSSSSPLSVTSTTSTDSLIEYDWDGPLCTICFSEAKNVILLPCQHGGIGQNCAKLLDMCHLCRSTIDDRVLMNDIEQEDITAANGGDDDDMNV